MVAEDTQVINDCKEAEGKCPFCKHKLITSNIYEITICDKCNSVVKWIDK